MKSFVVGAMLLHSINAQTLSTVSSVVTVDAPASASTADGTIPLAPGETAEVPWMSPVVSPSTGIIGAPLSASSSAQVEPLPAAVSDILNNISPAATVAPVAAALAVGTNPYSNPYSDPYSDPYNLNSPYGSAAGPAGWEGEGNGIYEGEDSAPYQGGQAPVYTNSPSYGGDDEEECPAWCMEDDTSAPEDDYSPYQPAPTPEYPGYSPVAAPDQEYAPTAEYAPYQQYPTPAEEYPAPTADYEPYPSQDDSNYPPQEPQYYPEPTSNSYSNKARAVRRQAYNNDDAGVYDGEDGSIPDWLYDISGAPPRPTSTYMTQPKPTCPASCYKPKTSAHAYEPKTSAYAYRPKTSAYAYQPERPTYTKTREGGYRTADSYEAAPTEYHPSPIEYHPSPTDVYYAPDEPTDVYSAVEPTDIYSAVEPTDVYSAAEPTDVYSAVEPTDVYSAVEPTDVYYAPDEPTDAPYSGYTSVSYPEDNGTGPMPAGPTNVPVVPSYVPEEPTAVPPMEPTTLLTQYQSQAYPAQTSASNPGSPAGDYTGDSLDTICPNVCNPFNPAENFCDITTGCTTTGGSKYYCACRAGFRADDYNAKDFSKQFKVAGQPYVYLAVSTSCNTVCSDSTCSEVLERSQCK